MFVLAWVGEDLSEVRVSPGAAAVLWWAGPLRAHQGRVVSVGVGVEQLLDGDLVLPVIAEVVGVAEAGADIGELAQSDLALVAEAESSGSGTPNSSSPKEKTCMW